MSQKMKKDNHTPKKQETITHRTWRNMLDRCYNKNNIKYNIYGGRGIYVCKRWKKFSNFIEDMGERPKNKSLDRINDALEYNKQNCKWSTIKQQNRNKRNNRIITYKNKTMCFSEWAEHLNINKHTLFSRINLRNWSIEKAFNTPVRKKTKKS